jgi:hypothetical protein
LEDILIKIDLFLMNFLCLGSYVADSASNVDIASNDDIASNADIASDTDIASGADEELTTNIPEVETESSKSETPGNKTEEARSRSRAKRVCKGSEDRVPILGEPVPDDDSSGDCQIFDAQSVLSDGSERKTDDSLDGPEAGAVRCGACQELFTGYPDLIAHVQDCQVSILFI